MSGKIQDPEKFLTDILQHRIRDEIADRIYHNLLEEYSKQLKEDVKEFTKDITLDSVKYYLDFMDLSENFCIKYIFDNEEDELKSS